MKHLPLLVATAMCALSALPSWGGPPPNVESCESWSSSDWDAYINQVLLGPSISWKTASTLSSDSQSLIKTCRAGYDRLGISRCMDRMNGYFRQVTFTPQESHMFSAVMTDQQYYESEPADKVTLPPEFANAANGLPKDWRDIAKRNGWTWAKFQSNTDDESRLVIRIPDGPNVKLLIYFSAGCNTDPISYQGVQLQYVEYNKAGKAVARPQDYFKFWDFKGPEKTPHVAVNGGRCVECHASGPRAIYPKSQPCFPTELSPGTQLESFNS